MRSRRVPRSSRRGTGISCADRFSSSGRREPRPHPFPGPRRDDRPASGRRTTVRRFINRHPLWSLAILVVIAILLWLIIAPWPAGLVGAFGRKKIFLNALFNGITLGGLYFLVASGFTLIFGLMRNVNLAHGSLYLLGGYIGYEITEWTGSWAFSFVVAFADGRDRRHRPPGHHLPLDGGAGSAPDPGDHRGPPSWRRTSCSGSGAATSTRSSPRTGWWARSRPRSSPPSAAAPASRSS